MARFSFGGELSTAVVTPITASGQVYDGTLKVAPATAFVFYDARGGSVVTDFLLFNPATGLYDISASSITSTAGGNLPLFQGPDGLSLLWAQSGADWLRFRAVDAVSGSSGAWADITGKPLVIGAGATASDAQTALGMTAKGKEVAIAADAAAVRTAAGVTQAAINTFLTSGDTATARTAIQAAGTATTVTTTTAQTISGVKTFTTPPILPEDSIPADRIIEFNQAVTEANDATFVPHVVVIDEGDPEPAVPTSGIWFIAEREAPATVADVTGLFGGASSTDATSWNFTLTRAFAAGSFGLAFVGMGSTTASASPALTVTGGGLTWAIVLDALGNPMTTTIDNGNNSWALFKGTGTPSGTTITTTSGTTMQGATLRVVEVVGGSSTIVQGRKTSSTSTTTPTVSFTGANASNFSVGFVGQNTLTDLTVGTGYTEIGGLVVATAPPPTMSIKTQWRADAINSMNFSGATAAQKAVFGVEIARV